MLALTLFAASSARADEVDLTDVSRPGSHTPAMVCLLAEGGSNFAPFGNAGLAVSYFNEFAEAEVEAGAGAGFPGVQGGVNLRKLFGVTGDYLAVELGLAYNSRVLRGADATVLGSGAHAWSNVGVGYEHRAGFFSLGFAGGISLTGFSQSPFAYFRASIGIAIW